MEIDRLVLSAGGHLGAGPSESTFFKDFSNKSHEGLVIALVAANFEALVISNVVL